MMPSEEYWQDYGPLQAAKHEILEPYLQAWFPMLASFSGRVVYVDCCAGRGRHGTGQEGSPLLALKTLLKHEAREWILKNTEVVFTFFEKDEANHKALQCELEALQDVPDNVTIQAVPEDYQQSIESILGSLEEEGKTLAPLFAFLDPFGFKISLDLVNRILRHEGTELLITFMFRKIDMAIHNEALSDRMDELFGTTDWESCTKSSFPEREQRREAIVRLFADQLSATWVTPFYMESNRNRYQYILFHASNHDDGRRKIKEAMWKTSQTGDFTARENRDRRQALLMKPEPDWKDLTNLLWENFSGKEVSADKLHQWLLETRYREPHLHKLISYYRNKNALEAYDYGKRFAWKRNPTLVFPEEKPGAIPDKLYS